MLMSVVLQVNSIYIMNSIYRYYFIGIILIKVCFNQCKNNRSPSLFLMLFPFIIFTQACSYTSAISDESKHIDVPKHWQTESSNNSISPKVIHHFDEWVNEFNDSDLITAINIALANNNELKSQSVLVALAKENILVSQASDFPELSLSANNTRSKVITQNVVNYQTTANVRLNLSYEVDLWGALSAQQQQLQLLYSAAKSEYQYNKLSLITRVIKRWYSLVEAQKLLSLFQNRATNLTKNLEMIKSSYQLGIGDALDVYLTQNNVNSELAGVAQQQQVVTSAARTLEVLLGEYPKGVFDVDGVLPKINKALYIDTPTGLLTRRSDIVSSWFELLALDANLAVTHKQRFPKFALTGNISDSDSKLSDLLNGNTLAWSLIGNLTAPILNGGRLASLEEQARLQVVKKEQEYLSQVHNAFAEVENLMSNRKSLLERLKYFQQAEDNALAAKKLSFEQYMRGLVTYTTVLEAQRRAFDAQTTVIQLTNLLLQNRADSYLAFGGGLESTLLVDSTRSTLQEQ